MEGMDRQIKKKSIFFRKIFWIWLIGIAISFFSYKLVIGDKTSKMYVGINKYILKNKK